MATLTDTDKLEISQSIKHARLVSTSRKLARIVKHKDPAPKDKAVRTRLEKDIGKWIRYYGGEAFGWPWSDDHKIMLQKLTSAINDGGLFAVAMPRGQGKTTILRWAILYVMLTGRRKYVITIAATGELANAIIEFCRQQIMENDRLQKHYPHVTTYARATDDKAIKARYQLRADGKPSGLVWTKTMLVLPEVLDKTKNPYTSNGAILEGYGLTGAIRGKWRDSKDGKVLRPDFVLLDDPQTRESGESPSQCDMRERVITGDILGMAGPNKRIAAVMPCTIIRKGDLSDRFLDHKLHPEWQGETSMLVKEWPDEQEELWEQYRVIYREETSNGRGIKRATKFYKANKVAMDKGAKLSWDHRIRQGELSALQTAENLMIELGDQFWAEMQNEPQEIMQATYIIEPKMVVNHTTPDPKYHVPDQSRIIVAFSDINRVGLHWVVAAYDQQMSAHVLAYGKYPENKNVWEENAPELARKRDLFTALVNLGKHISTLPLMHLNRRIRPSMLLIDRGYEPETVHRFCQTVGLPIRTVASRGYAAQKYNVHKNTLVGKPFEQAHVLQSRLGQFLAHNADYWREIMQRAWLGETGIPGGATLYKADPKHHVPFAEHICAERLRQKYQTDSGMRWEWGQMPGVHNDWADALTGCYVAAAATGLNTSGAVQQERRKERRKARVQPESYQGR